MNRGRPTTGFRPPNSWLPGMHRRSRALRFLVVGRDRCDAHRRGCQCAACRRSVHSSSRRAALLSACDCPPLAIGAPDGVGGRKRRGSAGGRMRQDENKVCIQRRDDDDDGCCTGSRHTTLTRPFLFEDPEKVRSPVCHDGTLMDI